VAVRRGRQRGWFLAGYAGIAGFLALEALTRQPGEAASLQTSADDQGTTRLIVIAYGLAAELPLVLRRVPAPELPPAAAPIGLAVQAAGLGLRACWAGPTSAASPPKNSCSAATCLVTRPTASGPASSSRTSGDQLLTSRLR
jgi:hypothetical protein